MIRAPIYGPPYNAPGPFRCRRYGFRVPPRRPRAFAHGSSRREENRDGLGMASVAAAGRDPVRPPKGWRPAFPECPDNEVAPLAAESGGAFVALVKLEPGSGECLFELRDELRPPTVILQGPTTCRHPRGPPACSPNAPPGSQRLYPPTTVRCTSRPPRRRVDSRRRPRAPHVEQGIGARMTAATDPRPPSPVRIPNGVVYI